VTKVKDPLFRSLGVEAFAEGDALLVRVPATGQWLRLHGTALAIWDGMDYLRSPSDIAAALAPRFDATPEQILPDVTNCLGELTALGLIEVVADESRSPMRDRYLGLLKRAVSNSLYPELELQIDYLQSGEAPVDRLDRQRRLRDIRIERPGAVAALAAAKRDGMGQGKYAHSISGMVRLTHIERCAERIFAEGIPGDFLEAGVCRGGAAILMRGLQIAHGEGDRRIWVVDSFAGVAPSASARDRDFALDFEEPHQPWLACDLATVRSHFERYDLLDEGVRFLPGWIAETLPGAPIGPLALLRLDLDLYSATLDALELLYDRVVPGGYVLVDDYGYLPATRAAVDDFRERRGIVEPVLNVDRIGSFWRKA
jgi:hypothetical protein